MIEVNGLVKRFDGFAALDGAALSVPAGSVYGLVGPNGAGKSTLIRHLTGIFRQDAGTVRIGGEASLAGDRVDVSLALQLVISSLDGIGIDGQLGGQRPH